MSNLTEVTYTNGSLDSSVSGAVSTIDALMADGGQATIGAKTDAASTATDATAASMIAILKQLSVCLQALQSSAFDGQTAGSANSKLIGAQGDPDGIPMPSSDAGASWPTSWGVSGVPVTTSSTFSTTAVTDAPTSGDKLVIDDILFSCDAATKLTLAEETSGTIIFGPWYFPASPGPVQITLRGKKKLATADKKLVATTVGSANASIQVGYHSEA